MIDFVISIFKVRHCSAFVPLIHAALDKCDDCFGAEDSENEALCSGHRGIDAWSGGEQKSGDQNDKS